MSGQLQTNIRCQWRPWLVCCCHSSGGLHLCIIHSGNEQCTCSVPCTSSTDHHPTWVDSSNICGNYSCGWLLHYCWKHLPTADHCQEWRRWCNVSMKHAWMWLTVTHSGESHMIYMYTIVQMFPSQLTNEVHNVSQPWVAVDVQLETLSKMLLL